MLDQRRQEPCSRYIFDKKVFQWNLLSELFIGFIGSELLTSNASSTTRCSVERELTTDFLYAVFTFKDYGST